MTRFDPPEDYDPQYDIMPKPMPGENWPIWALHLVFWGPLLCALVVGFLMGIAVDEIVQPPP